MVSKLCFNLLSKVILINNYNFLTLLIMTLYIMFRWYLYWTSLWNLVIVKLCFLISRLCYRFVCLYSVTLLFVIFIYCIFVSCLSRQSFRIGITNLHDATLINKEVPHSFCEPHNSSWGQTASIYSGRIISRISFT